MMDTNAVKLLIESHLYHVSMHQLGDVMALHAFEPDETIDLGDAVAVPSDLKIVRVDDVGFRDTAVAMIELARMCGIELGP